MNVGLTKDLFQSLICFRLLHCFRWRLDQEKAQYVHHSTKKVDVCRNISTYQVVSEGRLLKYKHSLQTGLASERNKNRPFKTSFSLLLDRLMFAF